MSNKILSVLFGVALAALTLSTTAMAEEPQKLAEMHVDMDGCEGCHKDGKASTNGEYEFEQCQSCHDTLANMDEVHKPHDGVLYCSDCHAPHETFVEDTPKCDVCHDDGRTPESVLEK